MQKNLWLPDSYRQFDRLVVGVGLELQYSKQWCSEMSPPGELPLEIDLCFRRRLDILD